MKGGKVKWQIFNYPILYRIAGELTENQLRSSGIFSQDLRHCRFSQRSEVVCKDGKLNQKNLEIVSSSCPCSTTSTGQRRETKGIVFQIQIRSRRTRRDSRKDVGRSLGPGDEKKLYGGNRNYKPERKWDSVASKMVQRFKETGHPIFTGASALSRGILKRLKGKETLHFNAVASNTELLFRIIHASNQLSIYGAVSQWSEQFPSSRQG